jgi:hypothetical protein
MNRINSIMVCRTRVLSATGGQVVTNLNFCTKTGNTKIIFKSSNESYIFI